MCETGLDTVYLPVAKMRRPENLAYKGATRAGITPASFRLQYKSTPQQ
jgi:hypothetical protein